MTHRSSNHAEERQDELRRFGLASDPYADCQEELELADRLGEQASLGPGSPAARALARHRLGRGPSPYEQAQGTRGSCFGPGERVVHQAHDGSRRCGRVVERFEHDDVVVVDFGRHGRTAVDAAELESEAA